MERNLCDTIFEIEFRARFDKEKFGSLRSYLDAHAESLGADDKDCYYYIFPDKLLKLVKNISKGTAKLSLKLNRIGEGPIFPETEIEIPAEDFDKAKKLLDVLDLPVKVMHDFQRRTNYRYEHCEIALKYSDAWGYHLEIEQVVDSEEKREKAERRIRSVADELGVKLMSEEELKKFTQDAER